MILFCEPITGHETEIFFYLRQLCLQCMGGLIAFIKTGCDGIQPVLEQGRGYFPGGADRLRIDIGAETAPCRIN